MIAKRINVVTQKQNFEHRSEEKLYKIEYCTINLGIKTVNNLAQQPDTGCDAGPLSSVHVCINPYCPRGGIQLGLKSHLKIIRIKNTPNTLKMLNFFK